MMINYQEYVESNIRWIGKIPASWGVSKIGRHFKLERGRVISNLEIVNNVGKYPVYSSQTKNNGELGYINTYDFDGEYVSWTTDGANAGTCFYRKGKFNVTNVCGLISSFDLEIDYKYLSFFLNLGTKNFVRKDINPKLMNDMMSEIPILIVPIKEQKLISQYLDQKSQKIDSLIEKIEKKVELHKEQKNALINQYVTKGIDPNVVMKGSGVEWIGDIPKHWELRKIKHICKVRRGSSPRPIDDPKYFDENGEFSWVRISDVSSSEKYLLKTTQRLSSLGSSLSTPIEIGDLFLSIAGSVGKPILTKIKCCIHDGFVWFDDISVDKDYLFYIFLVGTCFQGLGKMGTQLNLNTETVGEIKIPLPNPQIQRQIIENLEFQLEIIDSLIKKLTTKKNLLIEYRQSLISSIVTGKFQITEDMV